MSFVRQQDKNLSLGAGILIDSFLKDYGLKEKNMNYGLGKYGKPFFTDHQDIFFNISHSESYVMAAFSSEPVGCDIEKIRDIDTDISVLCLAPGEKKEDLLKIWTMKESFLKKEGCGLNNNIKDLNSETIKNLYQIDQIPEYWTCVCTQNPCEIKTTEIDILAVK